MTVMPCPPKIFCNCCYQKFATGFVQSCKKSYNGFRHFIARKWLEMVKIVKSCVCGITHGERGSTRDGHHAHQKTPWSNVKIYVHIIGDAKTCIFCPLLTLYSLGQWWNQSSALCSEHKTLTLSVHADICLAPPFWQS